MSPCLRRKGGRNRWREGKRDGGGGKKGGKEREKKKMHPEDVMGRPFKDWQNSSILLVARNVVALGQPCLSLLGMLAIGYLVLNAIQEPLMS